MGCRTYSVRQPLILFLILTQLLDHNVLAVLEYVKMIVDDKRADLIR